MQTHLKVSGPQLAFGSVATGARHFSLVKGPFFSPLRVLCVGEVVGFERKREVGGRGEGGGGGGGGE